MSTRPPLHALLFLTAFALALGGCDGGDGEPDAGGGMDAAAEDSGAADAGDDSGRCNEFTPEFCPQVYPMRPIPYTQLCNTFAEVFCRANGNCCTRPDETYGSWSACVSDQLARCQDAVDGYVFGDSIAAGDISYSQAAGGEVLSLTGPMLDACTPVRIADYLTGAMQGRLAASAPCSNPEVCGMGLACLPAGDAAATCRATPTLGSTCATHADCDPGDLRCDATLSTCEARLADGATCTADLECESQICMDGTCAEWSPDNAFCVRLDGDGRAFAH